MNSKIKKAIDLIEKAEIANQSVIWWEKEVINILSQLDSLGENPKGKKLTKAENLLRKLESLLPRGQMEINNIDKIEVEIQEFLKNEKANKKTI
jgi:hypothetical protein